MFRSRSTPLLTARRNANVHDRCTRGIDVARLLLAGLEALPERLVRRTPQAAGEPVGSQHEPGHGLPGLRGPAAEPDPAHRQHAGRRVAGEQVRDRHPVVGEQAQPVAGAPLDDRRVGRPVGDEHPAELPVVPAERGYAGAGPVQDALLAGRRGARQLHRPLLEAVAARVHPAPERRHRARTAAPTAPPGTAPRRAGRRRRRRPRGPRTLALRWPNRRSAIVKASSVPAVASQVRKVPTVAAIQVAATRVQNDDTSTPGTTSSARCITIACPAMASAADRQPADGGGDRDQHGPDDHAEDTGHGRGRDQAPRRAGGHAGEQPVRREECQRADRPGHRHAHQVGGAQPGQHGVSVAVGGERGVTRAG